MVRTGDQRHSDDNVEIIIITIIIIADEASSSCHVSHAGEQKSKNQMMSHTLRLGGSPKPTEAVRAECTVTTTNRTTRERLATQMTECL